MTAERTTLGSLYYYVFKMEILKVIVTGHAGELVQVQEDSRSEKFYVLAHDLLSGPAAQVELARRLVDAAYPNLNTVTQASPSLPPQSYNCHSGEQL